MSADPRLVSLLVDACRGTLGGPDEVEFDDRMHHPDGGMKWKAFLAALREVPPALRRDDCVCGKRHLEEDR